MEWHLNNLDTITVFVDVDGTLLHWPDGFGRDPQPNAALVRHLRRWKKEDYRIFVWSRAGKEHAEKAVQHCGIADIVEGCMNKPLMMIDDDYSWIERVARLAPPSGT